MRYIDLTIRFTCTFSLQTSCHKEWDEFTPPVPASN